MVLSGISCTFQFDKEIEVSVSSLGNETTGGKERKKDFLHFSSVNVKKKKKIEITDLSAT